MKNVPAVQTALQGKNAVKALPELIIDWNMNRYIGVTADNTPKEIDAAFDAEFFPIESIVEPLRPTKGINKARVGSATISDDYLIGGAVTPNGRFYIADIDDTYKYWTSQAASDASTGAIANVKPQVVYASSVAVNKIVITLENTWASPKNFSIQTTTVAAPADTDWTTVATQTTTPGTWKGTGQIVIYYNGTNWTNAARVDNADKTPKTVSITGVRLIVTDLEGGYKVTEDGSVVASTYGTYVNGVYTTLNTDGKDAFFDLIEISARLEVDLSPYLIEVSDDFELSDADNLYPVGTLTSNTGSMTLSNLYSNGNGWVPGLFNENNAASPYRNYIDANAKVTLKYKYYDESDALIGTVQEFEMYTDVWTGQGDESVSVDLADYSKFFNAADAKLRPAMWENLSVPEIVWRILDSVGFVNYHIDQDADRVTEHKIPVFYTDGESNVWEVLDDLAKASQTAIYFDSYGKLQVKTRDFAFSAANAPVWTFRSTSNGTVLPDIIKYDQTESFEPNHYSVSYQNTNWSPNNANQPTMQQVWEPDDTVTLRATQLVRNLAIADTLLYIGTNDIAVWPYTGLINVEGELIRYEGKQFVYYTGTTGATRNVIIIKDADEHNARNSKTPWQYRHKNGYTGALAVTERGVWNSEPANHYVDIQNYSVRHITGGTRRTNVAGLRHLKQESQVELHGTKRFKDYKDILLATHGATTDTPFFHYGTKFMFKKGSAHQRAGIIIHGQSGSNEDGYYIEFTPTSRMAAKERKSRNEMIVYSRSGGKDVRIGGKGASLAIAEGIWYEVDIYYQNVNGNHRIKVWVNGKGVFDQTISGANRNTANGQFGMFLRGKSDILYEYLYGIARNDPEPPDDFSFLDKVERGYTGGQLDREWVYQWRTKTRRVKKKTNIVKYRFNQMFFDEFGPYAHEIREFKVNFEPSPVLHSRLYMTNDWGAIALEYSANPFGAKFLIANTSRSNTVIHGDDTLSYAGTSSSINQVLTVFGRALVVDEAEELIAENAAQIRRRGKVESELSSTWIQSKTMAQALVNWMNAHFSYGNESVSLEVFGNPLIEVADVVHVVYPDKYIDDDFFVTGISNSFDQGVATTLQLRKRV